MAEFLHRVGRWSARRARTVIAAWFAILVAVGVAYALGGGTLATGITIPGTPTAEVTDRLATTFPEASGATGTIVVTTEDGSAFTADQERAIAAKIAEASEVDGVEAVLDPFVTETERAAQRETIDDGLAQLDAGRTKIDEGQDQLDAARAQAKAAGALGQVGEELDAQQATIDESLAEIEAKGEQLDLASSVLEMSSEIRTVSEDGSAAIVVVSFSDSLMDVPQETKDAVMATFENEPIDGVAADFSADISNAIPSILGAGEVIGLVIAAVVLVVMLGTLVGAGLPILTALVGVGIGALGAMSLSGVVDMISVTPILGVMLGLAVGIDYSLFIVNRHRRQLKQGYEVHESIGLANGTSGNAVVFAGTTVFIALLALNVTGIPFLGLMGTIGAMCVAIAVLVAVTLTPALLSLLGMRILSRRERSRLAGTTSAAASGASAADGEGAADATGPSGASATPVRPMSTGGAIVRVLGGIAALLLIAIPALDLRLGLPDGSAEAKDSTQYRAYTTLTEKFGAGQNGTILVVADLPGSPAEDEVLGYQVRIAETLFDQDDVVAVAPIGVSKDRSVATFQVVPADGPTTESTEALVHALRGLSPLDGDDGSIEIAAAGQASGNIDVSEKLDAALPLYLGVVVGLSLIILILVFRSVFVPLIATTGFILSFFAALGGVVAIYQWGWLGGVFGVDNPGPILSFLPTILVGILFGLAMDYQLFLGSGMREAYAHGASARVAVVQGFRAGRAVVTAAAVIMVSVFGGFIFSHSAMIRPIGFALAFGVLVDAFVVRMLVVPALMHLVGDKAWWLPTWLDRVMPDVDVEGAALERRHPHADAKVSEVGEVEPLPAK